jgi:aminoglycoside/choline kinase family phosphotransferase
LNEVLGEGGHLGEHRVVGVSAKDVEEPGQTAEVCRVVIEYDRNDCPLPRSMIAKYTTRNQELIDAVISVYQTYWREFSFYSELPDVGLPVPTCYHVAHDFDSQQFILLMNDLAPAESPSWLSTSDHVRTAAEHLPAFHAKWWNSSVLREKEWLVQFDNRDFYAAAAGAAAAAVPLIEEHFGGAAAATMELVGNWHNKVDAGLQFIASRPFTLVHGDYHAKQMFFPTDTGGDFAVIDWQFSFVAQGAWDFIRISSLGQDVDSRRANEKAMVNGYLEGLKQHGVNGYSREQLEDDIRMGLIVNQMIMAVAMADTDISVFQKECEAIGADWRDVLLLRGESAVRDWDVVNFLKSL